MTDRTTFPGAPESLPSISVSDDNRSQTNATDPRQGIFDDQLNELMNEFVRACEAKGIHLALVLAMPPTTMKQKPIVFMRGHFYDVAAIMAEVLREIKSEIYATLTTDPITKP